MTETLLSVGNVAKCYRGRTGIITKVCHNKYKKTKTETILYKGVGFDGKPWQSSNPTLLAETIEDYIEKVIYGT